MNALHSDALVFFGATGDLAYKKIFPSLQAMVKRGHLEVGDETVGEAFEAMVSRNAQPDEVDAYERVLTDAVAGDIVCASGLCGRGVANRRSGAEAGHASL